MTFVQPLELSHLRYALDESAIVAITDAAGVIIHVNDTFCRISGYQREELLGRTHRIINSGLHDKAFFADMWSTIQRGDIWRGEVCNVTKDGQLYWVSTTIVPLLSDDGTPIQYTAIRFDITHRKSVEAELKSLSEDLEYRVQERTRQLQATEKQRERFVAALTHDMRTPLIGQQRALDILESYKDALPERVQPFFTQMQRSNRSLLDMVSRLLEVSDLESGKAKLKLQQVSLRQIFEDAISDVAPLSASQGATITFHVDEGLSGVWADPDLMNRLLVNLLGNSLHHVPAKTGQINVDASFVGPLGQSESAAWQIRLRDNGPGIPPDEVPTLFERYRMSQKRKIGSGLGLSICQMIMRQHGGTIAVDLSVQDGACFVMTFPPHALTSS